MAREAYWIRNLQTKMNVQSFRYLVNYESLKKDEQKELDYAFLQDLFYQDSSNKEPFVFRWSKLGYFYHALPCEESDKKQSLCPFGVAPQFAVHPERNEKKARPRKAKEDLYPEIFNQIKKMQSIEPKLPITLTRFCNRWKIFIKNRGGNISTFWGMAKGTPSYSRFMRNRIIDSCAELQKEFSEYFICSPTVAVKKDDPDLQAVWDRFYQKLNRLEKALRKKFGCKMVVAIESTRKFYPHAHILIFANGVSDDLKHRYSRSGKHSYICGGRLRNTINAVWGSDIADLQECRPEAVKFYAAKYAGKNTESDFLALTKKSKWDKTDYKEVATVLLPMLFGIRQFRIPRLSKAQKQNIESKKRRVFYSVAEKPAPLKISPTAEQSTLETDRVAVVLDCVRNNSPLPCLARFFEGDYFALKSQIGLSLDNFNALEQGEKEKALKKCCEKSCSKCAFSLWASQKVFQSGEMYRQWSVFDIFGNEIESLFNVFRCADGEEKGKMSTLRSFAAQKAFFLSQMPSEWSEDEKESVWVLIQNLDICLWQFKLSPKYATWASRVNVRKTVFNLDKYINKENGLVSKEFFYFFPLTYSANGIRIKSHSDKGEKINE